MVLRVIRVAKRKLWLHSYVQSRRDSECRGMEETDRIPFHVPSPPLISPAVAEGGESAITPDSASDDRVNKTDSSVLFQNLLNIHLCFSLKLRHILA